MFRGQKLFVWFLGQVGGRRLFRPSTPVNEGSSEELTSPLRSVVLTRPYPIIKDVCRVRHSSMHRPFGSLGATDRNFCPNHKAGSHEERTLGHPRPISPSLCGSCREARHFGRGRSAPGCLCSRSRYPHGPVSPDETSSLQLGATSEPVRRPGTEEGCGRRTQGAGFAGLG